MISFQNSFFSFLESYQIIPLLTQISIDAAYQLHQ